MTKKLPLLLLLLATVTTPAFASDIDLAAEVASRGLLLTLFGVYFVGVGVSLTPCLYPMIPITLSVIGAHSIGQKPIHGFLRAFTFVLGIAVIYTTLGVVMSLLGAPLTVIMQNKLFWLFLSVFFGVMGLSMLGLFEIQLPPAIAAKLQGKTAGKGGFVGAFFVGLVTGVAASPCGSPVLVSLAAYTAGSSGGKLFSSISLFFAYSLGMGTLFMVLGTFPAFIKTMPKSGGWMEDVKKLLGAVLIGVALYYLQFAFYQSWMLVYWLLVVATLVAGAVIVAARAGYRRRYPMLLRAWQVTGLGLALAAVWVAVNKVPAAFASEGTRTAATRQVPRVSSNAMMAEAKLLLGNDAQFAQRVSAVAAEGGEAEIITAATGDDGLVAVEDSDAWLTNEAEAVALARKLNRPLLVDFGATWCAACKELEHKTFPDPRVVAAMRDFVKVRIDATDQSDEVDALQTKYGAQSLPTVRFTDRAGNHLPQFDLKKFEKPDDFLKRLEKAKAAAGK